MENIEYLNRKLLRIEAEIKKLEEINNENNLKIQILKDEHKHINSELSYKLDELSTATSSSSFATAASISCDCMAKRVVDEPLVASRILAVDDNGESEEIKTKGSKWNR